MFEYLIWLIVFAWSPIFVLWLKFWKLLSKFKRDFIFIVVASLAFGVVWDFIAIETGAWFFPQEKILGVWILNVPLEEWLFIISFSFIISNLTIILKRRLK